MTEVIHNHMLHLRNIALEDVAHLEEKERTYGGSWKKRGGVGAFMMLARKWDRLEGIISRLGDAQPYDIFRWIEGEYRRGVCGQDGTALAEVRDLRRYLLLVEAEMVARGVVKLPNPTKSERPALKDPEPVPLTEENMHADRAPPIRPYSEAGGAGDSSDGD